VQSDRVACIALDSKLHSGSAFRFPVFADDLRASIFPRLRPHTTLLNHLFVCHSGRLRVRKLHCTCRAMTKAFLVGPR
jgi:hypothetical protein